MSGEMFLFLFVAVLAIGSSVVVVVHRNPVYCALALVVALFQVAALFLLLGAETIAYLQILVYAGAIMVLFLFVIMLLNLQHETERLSFGARVVSFGTGAVIATELVVFFFTRPLPAAVEATADSSFGSLRWLAGSLFTDHVLAFELTSVLLLVAAVGAVVIARRA